MKYENLTFFGIPIELLGFSFPEDLPKDPIDPDLLEGAKKAFELFRAYTKAGFTEDQAIKLLVGFVAQGSE